MLQLQKTVGRRVDLIEEGCLLPFAAKSAEQDMILIYERELWIGIVLSIPALKPFIERYLKEMT